MAAVSARVTSPRPTERKLVGLPKLAPAVAKRVTRDHAVPIALAKAQPARPTKSVREGSLDALSRKMREGLLQAVPSVQAPRARSVPPPAPPHGGASEKSVVVPKRLRHAADPTDYDVQIIAAYATPPIPTLGPVRVTELDEELPTHAWLPDRTWLAWASVGLVVVAFAWLLWPSSRASHSSPSGRDASALTTGAEAAVIVAKTPAVEPAQAVVAPELTPGAEQQQPATSSPLPSLSTYLSQQQAVTQPEPAPRKVHEHRAHKRHRRHVRRHRR